MTKKKSKNSSNPLNDRNVKTPSIAENIDYYFNKDGLMVFTEEYHLKRGYCCDSGCRHCPYNKKDRETETKNKD